MSKSMLNLSDKEIDRLSKEAAELYEPENSSMSWSKLEQKLDQQMPERPPDGFRFGRLSPYAWGAAIALVVSISFYSIKKIAYTQSSTRTAQTDGIRKSESGKDLHDLSGTNNSTQNGSDNSAITPNIQPLTDNGTDAGTETAEPNHQGLSKVKREILSSSNLSSSSSNSPANRKRRNNKSFSGLTLAGETVADNTGNSYLFENSDQNSMEFSLGKNQKGDNITRDYQLSRPAVVTSITKTGQVGGSDGLLNRNFKNSPSVSQKALQINRSLSIGFFFGPDYTNAGGIINNELGNNFGLTVGYYLNKRISINSGILYSNKFFWSKAPPVRTTNSNYSFSYAPMPSVENINGSMSLYEIPITLRYDFNNDSKSRFFVNAGASSYLIQNQSYIYFFHSPARSIAWRTDDNNSANYWFGVGDLSVGLEQDLGKGFSFQIEPYLRVPFQKMGFNELKLTSYGVLLGFRFSPVLGKTKR